MIERFVVRDKKDLEMWFMLSWECQKKEINEGIHMDITN